MRVSSRLMVSALAMVCVAGCGKESETPKPTPPKAPTVDTSKVNDLMGQAKDAGSDVMAKASAEASKQLDQAMDYIKDKKLDLADQVVSSLEKNKEALTPAIQTRLTQVRQALDAAKAAAK